MKKNIVQGLVAVAGLATMASSLMAQAPITAQVWDVQFVVDNSGPFAQGPNATQVGITIFARVGILPNTAASGTNNLGIAKVGGAGSATSGFRMVFSDTLSAGQGLSQGSVQRGNTADIDGRAITDTNGSALTGTFAPFRGAFTPQVAPNFVGSNTATTNGGTSNPATGSPVLFNLAHGRSSNFGSEGTLSTGNADTPTNNVPANLVGGLVPVYRAYYIPREDFSTNAVRNVNVTVSNLAVRYVFALSGSFASSSTDNNLGTRTFSFQVPTPGAAALAGLAAVAGFRRRRA